jgi:hypothetical protein
MLDEWVAGDVAESLATGKEIEVFAGSMGDYTMIEQWLFQRASALRQPKPDLLEIIPIIEAARVRVRIELVAAWPLVESLALAVIEKMKLDQEEVAAIWAEYCLKMS